MPWNLDITKGQGTDKIRSLHRSFAIKRFFFIYFSSFYWGKENRLLYRARLRYIEVRLYTEVPLYNESSIGALGLRYIEVEIISKRE